VAILKKVAFSLFMDEQKKEILDSLCTHIREEMLSRFRSDCCIGSVRAAIEILRYFGIAAKPLPVEVFIGNQALVDRVEVEGRLPTGEGEIERWYAEDGSWTVGLGFPIPGAPHHVGHLAATFEDGGESFLVDPSIGQATRPHRNIHLPGAWWAPIPDYSKFLQRESKVIFQGGGLALYTAQVDNVVWKISPDWIQRHRTKEIIGRVIRKIKLETSIDV
jgi:hypothetical protein